MLRSPPLSLRNHDDFSSPDPLAISVNDENADPAGTLSSPLKCRQSSPVRNSASNRQSIVSTTRSSSPFKTITEQNLSPWKIRVTVEAEPEAMEGGTTMTTRTIKIPLRQDSSPFATSQGNQRGRKRQSSTKNKRAVTPVGARSGSRGRRQSVTDLNIIVLGDDAESDDWTKQQSPGKRKTSKSRKKSVTNVAEEIRNEANTQEQEQESIAVPDSESPELRTIDLNRVSVRSRPQSIKQKDALDDQNSNTNDLAVKTDSIRKFSNNSGISYPTPSPTSSYHGSDKDERHIDPTNVHEGFDTILESEGFTMIDLDTIPSARNLKSSPESAGASSQPVEPEITKTVGSPDSQATVQQKVHLDTKPVPSYLMTVEGDSDISSGMPSSPPSTLDSMLQIPEETLASSTRKVTPQIYSSPKLPSPPKQVRKSPRSLGEIQALPKKVVKAGVALQSVVTYPSVQQIEDVRNTQLQSPAPTQEDLFGGFDSGTKRELRANLRFGEELAKRQKSSPLTNNQETDGITRKVQSSALPKPSNQRRIPKPSQIWRGESTVHHTPVVSNDNTRVRSSTDSHDFINDTSGNLIYNASTEQNPSQVSRTRTPKASSLNPDRSILQTQARREREWQLEREAVSKEIDDATPGRVIVIDSDDDGDDEAISSGRNQQFQHHTGGENNSNVLSDEDDEDIWLAEAQNSSSSPRAEEQGYFSRTEQQRQKERAAQVVNKPRRSLIPSLWKRGEDMIEGSTFLTNGDMSGMLWQQPSTQEKIKFGAGDIARQKRELSGSFDVDLMAGTPKNASEEDSASRSRMQISGLVHGRTHSGNETDELNEVSDDEQGDSEPSYISEHDQSFNTQPSSPPQPVKIPVNFNDSTLSAPANSRTLQTTPPQDEDPPRPSTPRSAMKGTRQSLGYERPDTPTEGRRVVFNERSMYLNDDGIESTMSAKFDSPQPEGGQLRMLEEKISVETEHDQPDVFQDKAPELDTSKKSGWLGWLWKSKGENNSTSKSELAEILPEHAPTISKFDGASEQTSQHDEDDWRPTSLSQPATSAFNTSKPKPKSKHQSTIPSYLLTPSYPSDPRRTSTSPPLSTSGEFTKHHFRTLHIIHAKSQRPRFHAPSSLRPALHSLLGWTMELDESHSGLGLFEWKVGLQEAQVLERFMQEVEAGWIGASGVAEGKAANVKWEWTVEELAEKLGRIVVGEVVRREEGERR